MIQLLVYGPILARHNIHNRRYCEGEARILQPFIDADFFQYFTLSPVSHFTIFHRKRDRLHAYKCLALFSKAMIINGSHDPVTFAILTAGGSARGVSLNTSLQQKRRKVAAKQREK